MKTLETLFHHDGVGPEPSLQHMPEETVISCSARSPRESPVSRTLPALFVTSLDLTLLQVCVVVHDVFCIHDV